MKKIIISTFIMSLLYSQPQQGQMQERICGEIGICPEDGTGSEFCWQLDEDSTSFTIKGNGCPNHAWGPSKNPNEAEIQQYFNTFYKDSKRAATPLNVGINGTPVMGSIGWALNSVPIFGPSDAESDDAYVNEGQTFDDCLAHAAECGSYHYHSESHCHQDNLNIAEDNTKHSPMFAVMMDGVPLFGARGANGVKPTDLDECGGHVGSGNDEYPFYHYHTTAQGSEFNVSDLNNDFYPYTVDKICGCMHEEHTALPGTIPDSNLGSTCVLHDDQTGWGQGDLVWQAILDNLPDDNCVSKDLTAYLYTTDDNSNFISKIQFCYEILAVIFISTLV